MLIQQIQYKCTRMRFDYHSLCSRIDSFAGCMYLLNKNRNYWKCTVKILFAGVRLFYAHAIVVFNAVGRIKRLLSMILTYIPDDLTIKYDQDHTQHQTAIRKRCMKTAGRHVPHKYIITMKSGNKQVKHTFGRRNGHARFSVSLYNIQ